MLKPTPRVDATIEGEHELTLRSLFEAEESGLLRYAFSLVGRRAVAEEIVQDVFLELHRRFDEVETPRGWLYRSVRNRAFHHIRRARREFLDGEDTHLSTAEDAAEPPEEELKRMEATGRLRELLEQLDEKDRLLIQLKYFEGLQYRSIGERMGLKVGTVGYRLHHILKDLAGKLESLGIDRAS
ncbi:MAG: RNA polymerase sigma factor [Planctomycetota bacterium]